VEALITLRRLFVCFLLTHAAALLWAVDPGRRISQYAHTAWRTQDGVFSGSPVTLAQTTDGYMWIGTSTGLVRFDGVHFTMWSPPAGQRLLDPRIFSLRATQDGSLWIGTGYSISRWKNGQLVNYPRLSGRIHSIVEGADGEVWLVRTQATDGMGPLCRVKDERLRCYGTNDGIPFSLTIYLDKSPSGSLWIGGYSDLSLWNPAASSTPSNGGSLTTNFANSGRRQPGTFASLKAIAAGATGDVWAAIEDFKPVLQLKHFEHGAWSDRTFPDIHVNTADVTSLFVDRDNALWVGTAHHGFFRAIGNDADQFRQEDGLSSNAVHDFYQDREGTLWVVTSAGLDNFRDLHVSSFTLQEGLSSAGASTVLARRDNSLWIGNFEALDFLKGTKLSAIRRGHGLPGQNVTTIFEDHTGLLWVGIDSGLWTYDGRTFSEVRHKDGSPLGIVFAITEDSQHDIWVRAGPHLDRIQNGALQEEVTSPQISTSYTLAANPQGGLVLGQVSGDLLFYNEGKTQTIPSNEVGNTRQIRDLLVEPDGSVWGTTLDELARWKDGVRRNLTTRNGLPCDGIFALVEDRRESIWLYTRCGLIEIEKSQLDAWWQHPDGTIRYTQFDASEGVQAGLTSLKPQATRSSDGRLWFVNGISLQMIDPEHLQLNAIPPPVHVEGVIADRIAYAPQEGLRLPALTRELEIEYTALSFVAPQKVRFRYKLDGRNDGWQDPLSRRQAFYTDLGPGRYRFHVIACNNDGVWNEVGASLDFSIAPAWYQTVWFRLLSVFLVAAVVWIVYRERMRQIARAVNAQFDERLGERTRIARDFHDTFLQTVQGSKMVADHALDEDSDEGRMRQALEKISKWLGQAVQEGREALHSLRVSTTEKNHLAEALQRATEDHQLPSSMTVAFSVLGEVRDLHPIVRDEVYRVGYEAIRNVAAHSHASRLEVEIRYGKDLLLRVRDNGVGMDLNRAGEKQTRHFGLQGMRERASQIRSKLTIASSTNTGTELTLIIPGSVVYRDRRPSIREKLREFALRLFQ
jgi:signal transduction histidine kinase/ligand-binding sensor domain-containing protein